MESTSTTCKRRRTLVSFSCPVFRPVAKALRQHGQAVSGAIQRGRTGRAEPLQHLQLHRLRPARAPEVHFCPFHQHRSNEPINDGHGPSDSSRAVDWFFCFVAPFGFESTLKATLVEGSEGIQRCPNHQDPERSGRPVVDPRTVHVLRCDHREAIYETADASQQRVHNQVIIYPFLFLHQNVGSSSPSFASPLTKDPWRLRVNQKRLGALSEGKIWSGRRPPAPVDRRDDRGVDLQSFLRNRWMVR